MSILNNKGRPASKTTDGRQGCLSATFCFPFVVASHTTRLDTLIHNLSFMRAISNQIDTEKKGVEGWQCNAKINMIRWDKIVDI